MMRTAKRAALLLAAVSLFGCLAVEPPPLDLSAVSIGPPPEDYATQIREYFKPSLLDPYSAVYEMRSPVRGWERANDGVMRVIWAVCGTVNAKNRLGGYVGQRPFLTMFHQARIIGGLIDHEPPKYMTSAIVERCSAWYGAAGSRP